MGLNSKKPTIAIKTFFKHGSKEWKAIDGDGVKGTGPAGTTTVGGVGAVGAVGTVGGVGGVGGVGTVGAIVTGAVVLCVHSKIQSVIMIYYKKVNKIIQVAWLKPLEFLTVQIY